MKSIVVFGASGNLAKNKLFPALKVLRGKGLEYRIFGFGRTPVTEMEFKEVTGNTEAVYITGEYDSAGMAGLMPVLPNEPVIYYLAIPTGLELVAKIVTGLAENGLITESTMIVVEKPFGADLESAKKLNRCLREHFEETQIYRIDHYLAKALVKNLFTLRFANPLLSSIWNGQYIDRISIKILETLGIGGRGGYFDQAGTTRDMLQSHLLQLAALTVMDKPESLSAFAIHSAKVHALASFRLTGTPIFGQYKGYLDEELVDKGSMTETYVKVGLGLDTEKWHGVTIELEAGKKQEIMAAEIRVTFRKGSDFLWAGCDWPANELIINIQPEAEITLRLNAQTDGDNACPVPTNLAFSFLKDGVGLVDAYETMFSELYSEDRSLFLDEAEIESSWRITDTILGKKTGIFLY